MTNLRDLRFSLYGAYDAGEARHAQAVIKELGISYVFAIPQSIADQWWFLGCNNVPEALPAFITDMEIAEPHELVGYGMSIEMANELMEARRANPDNPDAPLSPNAAAVPPTKP